LNGERGGESVACFRSLELLLFFPVFFLRFAFAQGPDPSETDGLEPPRASASDLRPRLIRSLRRPENAWARVCHKVGSFGLQKVGSTAPTTSPIATAVKNPPTTRSLKLTRSRTVSLEIASRVISTFLRATFSGSSRATQAKEVRPLSANMEERGN
jgi:hypothetical protein